MGSSVTKRERKLLDISFFPCKFAKKHRLFVSFLGMEGGDFAKKNLSPFLGRNETRWEEGRKIRPALKVSQICICEFSLSVSFPLSAGVNLPYQTEKENTCIFLKKYFLWEYRSLETNEHFEYFSDANRLLCGKWRRRPPLNDGGNLYHPSSIKCVVHCVCDREGAECGCRLLCGCRR